jgi:hypothetical protein
VQLREWNFEAVCLRSFQVRDQLELSRQLNLQIGRLFTFVSAAGRETAEISKQLDISRSHGDGAKYD